VATAGAKIGVGLCFAASVGALVAATLQATRCNPADPHLLGQEDLAEQDDGLPFCTLCDVPVHARSKHCRACNKCIHVFDHHCMWLNNCIGASNYRAFFAAIVSVAAMIGTILGTCACLIVSYCADRAAFEQRVGDIVIFESIPEELFFGMHVAMSAINAPLLVLDVQLVILHMFLMSRGLTTFDYIMDTREYEESRDPKGGQKRKMLGGGPRRRHVKLPQCIDWIVFSRCGQRRRRRPKDLIERIGGAGDSATPTGARAETPLKGSQEKHIKDEPSPPGSIVGEGGRQGTDAEAVDPQSPNFSADDCAERVRGQDKVAAEPPPQFLSPLGPRLQQLLAADAPLSGGLPASPAATAAAIAATNLAELIVAASCGCDGKSGSSTPRQTSAPPSPFASPPKAHTILRL